MIYIKSFKNYEEFKEIFAVREMEDGRKVRRNKILLACLKDRKLLHWWLAEREAYCPNGGSIPAAEDYLCATEMGTLKNFIKEFILSLSPRTDKLPINLIRLMDYNMSSAIYAIDNGGLCEDGDSTAVRYKNMEMDGKVFKMKAGKFISKIMEESCIHDIIPEQMKRWISEEFAVEWQVYAAKKLEDGKFTLHVNDDFWRIYDSNLCEGDFGSCMTDENQYEFYENAINAKAAYITNVNDMIVARCIVYQDVRDENGKHYRLAERQYSTNQDNVLKQTLVNKLIEAGEIDGYKRVGVDCHNNRGFVANDGSSMSNLRLRIECHLEAGDTLSYQDSFVYYSDGTAYNFEPAHYADRLDKTNSTFQGIYVYSEWYGRDIDEDDAARDEYYDDWMYNDDCCIIYFRGDRLTSNEGRIENNGRFYYSMHEDCYIYDTECEYVEEYDDYYLSDDCVHDIDNETRLKRDCKYSGALDEYIYNDYAKWSGYDQDWTDQYHAFVSDITGETYCYEDSMKEDEEKFKAEHDGLTA